METNDNCKASIISGNIGYSKPASCIVFPPDSKNAQCRRDFLQVPSVRYPASGDGVGLLSESQKRSSSRDVKGTKKEATQKGGVRAPDGGWGWIIVIASMGISLVADGVSFSFGIIYIEFLRYFGASKSKTSVIGSLFMAVPLMSGPLASALVDRYGCRPMTILGGIISAAGFVASSLSDSIEVMYFTFGVLSGLGLALCYVTAVVCVAFWFDKKRSLANGLGVCGTGVGTFLFAPMTQALIDEYGWRGTTLILAGAFLQMCVCGAVMREPDFIEEELIEPKEEAKEEGGAGLLLLPGIVETTSFVEKGSFSMSGRSGSSKNGFKTRGAVTMSLGDLPASVEIDGILPSREIPDSDLPSASSKLAVENKCPSHSVPDEVPANLGDRKGGFEEKCISLPISITPVTQVPDVNVTMAVKQLPSDSPNMINVTNTTSCLQQSSPQTSPMAHFQGLRFRRNSVTYRGAMLNINRYHLRASCPDIYRNSLTSIVKEKKESWYEDFLQILADMMDFSMFLEWHFMLLSFSTFLLFTFFIVPYFYLAEHVIGLGYSKSEASMLISIIGVLNTIGMIALGWAGDQAWMNVTKTYAFCLCLCGISTGIMPLLTYSYPLLATVSAFFGLFFASNFSFTPVLIVELISLDRFTMAYGLILLTQGLGNLLGPPLAGWLYDITNTWNLSFYLAGFFIFVSGLAIALITCTKNFTIGCPTVMGKVTTEKNREGISCKHSLLEAG